MGINVTSDEKGNYYLDQKKLIESAIKAAKVSGVKVQKLPYPLDGPSLSKADNAKTAKKFKGKPYLRNNNSKGTNGMHNNIPLTKEHQMVLGDGEAKATPSNPRGFSKRHSS